MFNLTLRWAKRVVIIVIGATVVLLGVALLVLPGPGTLVILGGLAILATEVVWARRLLRKARRSANRVAHAIPHRIRCWIPFLRRRQRPASAPATSMPSA